MFEPPSTELLAGARWTLIRCTPGAAQDPVELEALPAEQTVRLPARAPGTAAASWRDAFGMAAVQQLDPEAWDWWFLADFEIEPGSKPDWRLHSEGIAGYATIWLDNQPRAQSSGGFDEVRFDLPLAPGRHRLAIHIRPLSSVSVPRKPRPRWRSSLVFDTSLRWHRTPLMGHIPWFGTAKVLGPWAAITLRPEPGFELNTLRTELGESSARNAVGRVILGASGKPSKRVTVKLHDPLGTMVLEEELELANNGAVETVLELADPRRWFPHSHGEPELYQLLLDDGETRQSFQLGFREVRVDRIGGGFELSVNDVPIFTRGVVWAPPDALSLAAKDEDYRQIIDSLVRAGVNMIRISGTGGYEHPKFYQECDKRGILLWQDCMLATLDPPEDADWLARFGAETASWLRRLARHPCLTVLSGGNETEQQPTFWGLPPDRRRMTVISELIPALAAEHLPGVVHVSSSPGDGDNPIEIRQGVSHYFGVGAYQLPLTDARTSGVRFASEALAFASPPEPSTVQRHFSPVPNVPQEPVGWTEAVAADPGANWTFEDVTAHYAAEFFGTEHEPSWDRRMDRHRAALHHAVAQTMVEWRRPGSACAGALVLSARDLAPGAGWGVTDVEGRPKSTWYALKAACAPTALAFHPEDLNGVDLHLFHDRPEALIGTLEVAAISVSGRRWEPVRVPVQLAGRGSLRWTADELFGGFRDLDYIWKFGEREYDAIEAVLLNPGGREIARTVRLLGGVRRERVDTGLRAEAGQDNHGSYLDLSTDLLASFVAIDLSDHDPEDNYFHLGPNNSRRIYCLPRPGSTTDSLAGTVRALNDLSATRQIHPARPEQSISSKGAST
ncbi:beta-mannosidase [Psychromicrobium silvestre]|uniref:beta-mannosidase n=1 Tax=Psychromicrobium silvestre TaxID=1645614 RepID=A0A7Y9LV77_9MICC|nr:glycoside hydrolase family 2 protein [Psychromicrobium silvestre]NYE96219.1 beta-mannosidase [Psychromicrobium silvestre]